MRLETFCKAEHKRLAVALGFGCMLAAATVVAENEIIEQSVISGSFMDNTGLTAVNVAAGHANIQHNAVALAAGGQAAGSAIVMIGQAAGDAPATADGAHAFIGNYAFAGNTGVVQVSQIAGSGNVHANAVAIALGIEGQVVAATQLAGTFSGPAPNGAGNDAPQSLVLEIDETAFKGAHGLVQVAQSAGTGNRVANSFALNVQSASP